MITFQMLTSSALSLQASRSLGGDPFLCLLVIETSPASSTVDEVLLAEALVVLPARSDLLGPLRSASPHVPAFQRHSGRHCSEDKDTFRWIAEGVETGAEK